MNRTVTARIASYCKPDPIRRSLPIEESDELIARIKREIRQAERQIQEAKAEQMRQLTAAFQAHRTGGQA